VFKVAAADEWTRESLPAGARHISIARDGDLTCRVDFAAVQSAKAEAAAEAEAEAEAEAAAEAEAKAEAEPEVEAEAKVKAEAEPKAKLDGGPLSIDDIRRLEPV
jgi:hypothetical protein